MAIGISEFDVAGTAVEMTTGVGATSARDFFELRNIGSYKIFVGGSGVTVDTGIPVMPGSRWPKGPVKPNTLAAITNEDIYVIATAGNPSKVRLMEAIE